MARSTGIPLIILAGMALTPTEVGAASITYSIVNDPTLQNGYTVTGTITTNGATGTMLPGTDITSWDITISKGSTTVATLTPSDTSNITTGFDATTLTISAATSPDEIGFQNLTPDTGIGWRNHVSVFVFYGADVNGLAIWENALPSTNTSIATVPEPSSAVLAVIGAVSVVACGLVRLQRAQRRGAAVGSRTPT